MREFQRFDQNPDLQRDALKEAGCFRVFTDKASGTLDNRKELAKVLDQLRPGDTLVVWRLDRLGRSLRNLIETVSTAAASTRWKLSPKSSASAEPPSTATSPNPNHRKR